MAESVTIDKKGRLVLPKGIRTRAEIKARSKLIVDVKAPGVIELRDVEAVLKQAQQTATKKLAGWRKEDHDIDKYLLEMVAGKEN